MLAWQDRRRSRRRASAAKRNSRRSGPRRNHNMSSARWRQKSDSAQLEAAHGSKTAPRESPRHLTRRSDNL
eukprot:1981632-Pyramimonas_sp.AAC.1